MNCDEAKERLSEYLDGQMAIADKTRLSDHLAVCPVCRAELAILRKTVEHIKRLPDVPPPPDLVAAVRRRLTAVPAKRVSIGQVFSLPQARVALAAATVAILGFCGYHYLALPARRASEAAPADQTVPTAAVPKAAPPPAAPQITAPNRADTLEASPAEKARTKTTEYRFGEDRKGTAAPEAPARREADISALDSAPLRMDRVAKEQMGDAHIPRGVEAENRAPASVLMQDRDSALFGAAGTAASRPHSAERKSAMARGGLESPATAAPLAASRPAALPPSAEQMPVEIVVETKDRAAVRKTVYDFPGVRADDAGETRAPAAGNAGEADEDVVILRLPADELPRLLEKLRTAGRVQTPDPHAAGYSPEAGARADARGNISVRIRIRTL